MSTTKICSKCHLTKPLDEYHNDSSKQDGKRPECKDCKKSRDKEYRDKNIDHKREKDREYAKANAEAAKERAKNWYNDNKERAQENMKNWRKNNPEKLKAAKAKYNEENKEKMREWLNNYMKNRYATNLDYRVKSILNKRIRDGVRSKTKPTLEYLGCDIDYFKKWIEYQFDENMSWNNLGTYWQFDHVKPCASYDFSIEDDIKECYTWTNLRPLEKIENISKGDTVDESIINKHKSIVDSFLKLCQDQ